MKVPLAMMLLALGVLCPFLGKADITSCALSSLGEGEEWGGGGGGVGFLGTNGGWSMIS